MKTYYRALPQTDVARPKGALSLAGGWTWFTHVERLRRGAAPIVLDVQTLSLENLARIISPRPALGPLAMDRPQIMGILNVTPDSFSDGGQHAGLAQAIERAQRMAAQGAAMIDIGGESTRPGARLVPVEQEIARTVPVIAALSQALPVPISIDTRKAAVADAALSAGAFLVNDVAGFTYDTGLAPLCAQRRAPVCVMHAQGDPATMQDDPVYDDVLLDVFDFLEGQVEMLTTLGLSRDQIIVDPGIGFGKTLAHNLALLARLSLFHSLGCPVMLGASRKGFIRQIGSAPDPENRIGGSVSVALAGIAQGAQIVRVHDVEDMRQALNLWQAATTGEYHGA